MESLGALAMVTAVTWPLIGGILTGLVIGLVRKHDVLSTLFDAVAGGIVGYALVMAAMQTPLGHLPALATVAVTLGLPIVGGFIGVWLKNRFA